VAQWLDVWLSGRKSIRKSTYTRYQNDVRKHINPHLGTIRLDKLRVRHIDAMFDRINEDNIAINEDNALRRKAVEELQGIPWKGLDHRARRADLKAEIAAMPPLRRTAGHAAQRHLKATLRAALNTAIAQQILTPFNPAEHVELAPGARPKALVWTDARVAHWRETGQRPSPVMVWTPEQTGRFLDHVADHRLYAMWHLVAFRGLRRGEACGVRWMDINLADASLSVATQLVQDGWEIAESIPKTDSGTRTVALDTETLACLRAHRRQQDAERRRAGTAWKLTGRAFTETDGAWLNPGKITDLFGRLVSASGLPPIRLHDLRHGAATLMLAAGIDVKVVSDTLGHSNTQITRDVYQAVLDDLSRAAAEAVVKLVPRAKEQAAPRRAGSA
jgi:integrase